MDVGLRESFNLCVNFIKEKQVKNLPRSSSGGDDLQDSGRTEDQSKTGLSEMTSPGSPHNPRPSSCLTDELWKFEQRGLKTDAQPQLEEIITSIPGLTANAPIPSVPGAHLVDVKVLLLLRRC